MSSSPTSKAGKAGWIDLTVSDADGIRDFYAAVVGWTPEPVPMGEYSDYNMVAADGTPVAGVCHHRGVNRDIPPARWMIYFTVADLETAVAECRARGGKVAVGPKGMGPMGKFAVIEDPSGAVCALFQSNT